VPARYTKGEAYQRQAQSDFGIACCLSTLQTPSLSPGTRRRHIAAMCQQAVEKSVKSLYIGLGMMPKRTHQVTDLITSMFRKPAAIKYGSGVRRELHRVFSSSARYVTRELCEVVPRSNPDDPDQAARNSEYPFTIAHGWIAPCDDSAFRESEITRYLQEAGRVVNGVARIRAAIYRTRIA